MVLKQLRSAERVKWRSQTRIIFKSAIRIAFSSFDIPSAAVFQEPVQAPEHRYLKFPGPVVTRDRAKSRRAWSACNTGFLRDGINVPNRFRQCAFHYPSLKCGMRELSHGSSDVVFYLCEEGWKQTWPKIFRVHATYHETKQQVETKAKPICRGFHHNFRRRFNWVTLMHAGIHILYVHTHDKKSTCPSGGDSWEDFSHDLEEVIDAVTPQVIKPAMSKPSVASASVITASRAECLCWMPQFRVSYYAIIRSIEFYLHEEFVSRTWKQAIRYPNSWGCLNRAWEGPFSFWRTEISKQPKSFEVLRISSDFLIVKKVRKYRGTLHSWASASTGLSQRRRVRLAQSPSKRFNNSRKA